MDKDTKQESVFWKLHPKKGTAIKEREHHKLLDSSESYT